MTRPKSKKTIEKEHDETWAIMVKRRDKYTCQICLNKLEGRGCQAHHILPRQLKKLRWDVNNGITLCYNHHKPGVYSAHQNAIWFAFWLKTNKPDLFKYAINNFKKIGKPIQ